MKSTKVLVTGASCGMGRVTALYLSRHGYDVFAATRTPSRLMDIRSLTLHPVAMDITDTQSVSRAIEEIGGADVLINNAGYGLVSSIEEVRDEEMYAQFETNLFGLLRVTRAIIPEMRKRKGGVIINISSFLGHVGLPLLTLYNASKYAVEGVTDSLRHELHPFNIRVHSILPGFFATCFAGENLRTNASTFSDSSAYAPLRNRFISQIVEQINGGNDPFEVARVVREIIENENAPIRMAAGEKAKKFMPMRRTLDDEDFERRVAEYYGLR
jgi:NAD(P)-dependent dehydrogenase (short-subunit alcohol dehydrogenase family)